MNKYLPLLITTLCTLILAETHTVTFPLGRRAITIINENGQHISQHNTHTTQHVTPAASPRGHTMNFNQIISGRFIDYLFNNQLLAVAGALGLTYATVCGLLWYTRRANTHSWAHWKGEFSLTSLMNMPQELLTQELLQAVKMHYLPEEYAATNFLDPIVGFIHDCDTDILLFERLQKMRLVLVTMRLIKLFPYQLLDELYLTEKIGRLRYLKKIFVEGLPRYSVSTR